MPEPESLGNLLGKLSGSIDSEMVCAVSTFPARRKQSAVDSPSAVSNEDTTIQVAAGQKRCSSLRRPSRYNRLSDRWSVLSRIMRSSKSARPSPAASLHADATNSDTFDGTGDSALLPDSCLISGSAVDRQRIFHPASPKFPSPLSGVCPVKRLLLARHDYPHRGYSQSALYLHRDLWRRRKSEWHHYEYMLSQAGLTLDDAYGGMVKDANGHCQPLPSHLKTGPWMRKPPDTLNRKGSEMGFDAPDVLNYATFPRLGDLSAIRDPFLVSVDTWFADFPLWTLSKLIWIYDVKYRSGYTVRYDKHRRTVNTFLENFAMDYTSGDSSSDADADSSDTTLVDNSPVLPRSSKDRTRSPAHSRIPLENDLFRRCSLESMESSWVHNRPWEVCWSSRWEVLYNEVSVAADIAAFQRNSSSVNITREAVQVILSTSGVLYDPHHGTADVRSSSNHKRLDAYSDCPTTYQVVPMEEDEEDYGRVIPLSQSVYRLGAHVDAFSMFATATPEQFGPSAASSTTSGGLVTEASEFSRDYSSDIIEGLQQLAIYT